MTFGPEMGLNRIEAWLRVAVCTGFAAATPLAAVLPATALSEDWGLPQLMQGLAQVKSASAQFTERKTMHLLTAPLMTSGTLAYVAPDRMQKTTLAPVPEQFVLDRDQVTIVGVPDNQAHTFSLSEYPQIGGLVEGIRATLAGDLPTLERLYILEFKGAPADWQLLLQPRDSDLARFIKWIRIRGSRDRIEAIATESSDGDYSDMSIIEDVSDAR
jgi:outer membrane lipoprotein-sorting protein